jgi:hypothetical protein
MRVFVFEDQRDKSREAIKAPNVHDAWTKLREMHPTDWHAFLRVGGPES